MHPAEVADVWALVHSILRRGRDKFGQEERRGRGRRQVREAERGPEKPVISESSSYGDAVRVRPSSSSMLLPNHAAGFGIAAPN